jgi:hypothetical protein
MAKLPQRPENHNLEELSERFFINNLPDNWVSHKPDPDYGVDLVVDIFEGTDATGLEILVQLKSTGNATDAEVEIQQMNIATYNYLNGKLQVALIVKYVHPDNEAYWVLLKDIPQPNQENATFTVHIPKENRLSIIDWNDIKDYVQEVTERKRAAQLAHVQQQRFNRNPQQ